MGDMVNMALEYALATEMQMDDYLSGEIDDHDAYDAGLIDEMGCYTKDRGSNYGIFCLEYNYEEEQGLV